VTAGQVPAEGPPLLSINGSTQPDLGRDDPARVAPLGHDRSAAAKLPPGVRPDLSAMWIGTRAMWASAGKGWSVDGAEERHAHEQPTSFDGESDTPAWYPYTFLVYAVGVAVNGLTLPKIV